jgi:hypothetical protein
VRIGRAVLGLAVAATVAAGVAQLVWHGHLFAGRFGFPVDLEWMEGGMLVHAQRLAEGSSIYVEPTVDFVPFLYTPLYPALLALLSKLVPLGYALGRAVSLVSLAGALGVIVVLALREAGAGIMPVDLPQRPIRAASALLGIAGAGAFVGGFEFSGAFYDLVRNDSLVLLLEALALAIAYTGTSWRSAAAAGLVIALAFFTKQTAALLGVGIGIGLLIANWRRGLVYGVAAASALALGILYLVKSSGGWFWTYIFKLHQSHPFRYDTLSLTPRLLWENEYGVLVGLAVATVGLGVRGHLRRKDAVLWSGAVFGIASGIVGCATMWAWSNAYIPMLFFPTLALAVLGARLVACAVQEARPLAVFVAVLAVLALGWQSVQAGKPNLAARYPTPADHAAAGKMLDKLRTVPGELFIPFHPYYGVLVGKKPFLHRMGVRDVTGVLGPPKGLAEAIDSQRFSAIVIDWKSLPYEWPRLEARYQSVFTFRDGVDTVRHFSGAATWPRYLAVPIRPPVPVPVPPPSPSGSP